ncbi:MAG: prepilin-type N-terminal cleavage/methylation domain-containing protein [Candidatus Zixiibacteriota bacterium]|nr:MAG: prepilin-type N-terminal cleavage/methylation domain-containing protein [candidate division Zixibacteria bacterium]
MTRKISSNHGVTLIELMILSVIVGIVSAMAVPRFQIAMERMKIKAASRNVNSTFRLARSHAVSDKAQYGVYIGTEDMTITLFKDLANPESQVFEASDSVVVCDTLPAEFTWMGSDCEDNVVVFKPNGSAGFTGGGNIYLMASTEKVVAISWENILASTGRVSSNTYIY